MVWNDYNVSHGYKIIWNNQLIHRTIKIRLLLLLLIFQSIERELENHKVSNE